MGTLNNQPQISNFGPQDHIELGGTGTAGYTTAYNSATGTLTLLQGGSRVGAVHLNGSYSASNFTVGADSSGNTEVNFACFLRGTRIATAKGEAKVETLQIGDLVQLMSGEIRPIKWIGRRAYNGRFAMKNPGVLPVRFRPGALAEGVPTRDLYVSPKHAMFVDGVLVHADELVNGLSVVHVTDIMSVEYFHIELESHALILAEGAPTETFVVCDNRETFHNAAEFDSLYPDDDCPSWAFCAPLVEDGVVLEAVRKRIALLAGLSGEDESRATGKLLGFLDRPGPDVVSGWAQESENPDIPVRLEIYEHGVLLARTVADCYRPDLVKGRIGSGRHGFKIKIPPAHDPGIARAFDVRRASDGAVLPGSATLGAALGGASECIAA